MPPILCAESASEMAENVRRMREATRLRGAAREPARARVPGRPAPARLLRARGRRCGLRTPARRRAPGDLPARDAVTRRPTGSTASRSSAWSRSTSRAARSSRTAGRAFVDDDHSPAPLADTWTILEAVLPRAVEPARARVRVRAQSRGRGAAGVRAPARRAADGPSPRPAHAVPHAARSGASRRALRAGDAGGRRAGSARPSCGCCATPDPRAVVGRSRGPAARAVPGQRLERVPALVRGGPRAWTASRASPEFHDAVLRDDEPAARVRALRAVGRSAKQARGPARARRARERTRARAARAARRRGPRRERGRARALGLGSRSFPAERSRSPRGSAQRSTRGAALPALALDGRAGRDPAHPLRARRRARSACARSRSSASRPRSPRCCAPRSSRPRAPRSPPRPSTPRAELDPVIDELVADRVLVAG